MSDPSRRELLRNIGISLTLTGTGVGVVSVEAAQHVHEAVQEQKSAAKGVYKPKCFNSHEYQTLQALASLIIPSDEKSKGALEAGAPEFIDLLAANNAELAAWHPEQGLRTLYEWRNSSGYLVMLPRQRVFLSANRGRDTSLYVHIVPLDGGPPREMYP